MLFQVNPETFRLDGVDSTWVPKELELERYLVTQGDGNVPVMSESVFGEPLLLVSNQVRTAAKKRADIFALDRAGNGVIIELKRNAGRMGVETQALQYLADFSNYRGQAFLKKFPGTTADSILGFVGHEANLEDLNRHSRVILVARSFDETLFSMGDWMSSKGVAVRCIAYHPVEVAGNRYLSFSVAFDRSPSNLFSLTFSSSTREPGVFWHNISDTDPAWWAYLVKHNEIATSFQNEPGDAGEKILRRYIAGDVIVAYAKGFGAVGWGVVENPSTYRLLRKGDGGDVLNGSALHRLQVQWKATAKTLDESMSADAIRKTYGIHHPISTSVSMNPEAGRRLTAELSMRYRSA